MTILAERCLQPARLVRLGPHTVRDRAPTAQGRRFGHPKRVGINHRPQRRAARIAHARRAGAAATQVPPGLVGMVLAGPARFGRTSAHGALV